MADLTVDRPLVLNVHTGLRGGRGPAGAGVGDDLDPASVRPSNADALLEVPSGVGLVARPWSDVQDYVLGLPWRMPADTDADVTAFFKAQHDYALAQGLSFVRWKPRKDGKPWRVGMIAWHPSISIVCEGVPRFEAIDNVPLLNIARRVEVSPGVYEYQAAAPADQRGFIYLLARAPFAEGQSINTPSTEGYKFTISGALIYDGNKNGQTANGGATYNPASFIYAERGKNDPDYDKVAAANGDAKAYDAFRLEHCEVYNTSGTAFYSGPDRQRGHIGGKCRATGCGVVVAGVVKTEARGYEWRGNDCITDSGFGGGGNTGEGGYFGGNSGAMFVHGNYWNQNPYMPDAATAFTLANVNGAVALSNVFNASLVATVSASAANAKKGIAVLGNDCRIADELFLPGRASGDPLGVADISKNAAMVFAGYRQVQCVGNTFSPDKDGKAWAYLVSATDSAGVYASFSATSEPGKAPFAVSPFRAASGASIGYNWFDGYTGLLHLGVTAENTRVRGVQFDTQFGVISAAPTNLTEGGSYQLGLDVHNVYFSAASPLSAHTFILPKFPVDGRTVKITFDQAIAACTFSLASESTLAGHTIRSGAEAFSAGVGDSVEFQYREATGSKVWRRVAVMRNGEKAETSPVIVSATATPAQVKTAVETLNPQQESGSPAGMGRIVRLPAREILMPPATLSTMQSMDGAGVGSTILRADYTGMTAGTEYGLLTVAADSRSKRGIRGQGRISNLAIDGNRQAIESAYGSTAGQFPVVHGYVTTVDAKRAHVIDNVTLANCTGDGYLINSGGDQLIGRRMRAEGVRGVALRLSSASDVKLSDIGLVGDGGAAVFNNCAPEIDRFDMFVSKTAPASVAALIVNNCIGVRMSKGTIAGRTEIYGKNHNGNLAVRFGNTYHSFVQVKFKHDTDRAAPNSYILIKDADEVQLISAWFWFDRETPTADLPNYYIEFGTDDAGEPTKMGTVSASACGHWMESGRPGGEKLPVMGCRKHWATRPGSVKFDWGIPGQPEIVPAHLFSNPDPSLRTHVQLTGSPGTISKADYPFGYLCATLNKGIGGVGIAGTNGTLDDGATSAVLPAAPSSVSSDWAWAMRVTP